MFSITKLFQKFLGQNQDIPVDPVESFDNPIPQEDRIYWGHLSLPSSVALTHLLVKGAPGSGKTLILRMLLQSLIPAVGLSRNDGEPSDSRVLVFNPKRDFHPIVAAMKPAVPILTLDPFDQRTAYPLLP